VVLGEWDDQKERLAAVWGGLIAMSIFTIPMQTRRTATATASSTRCVPPYVCVCVCVFVFDAVVGMGRSALDHSRLDFHSPRPHSGLTH